MDTLKYSVSLLSFQRGSWSKLTQLKQADFSSLCRLSRSWSLSYFKDGFEARLSLDHIKKLCVGLFFFFPYPEFCILWCLNYEWAYIYTNIYTKHRSQLLIFLILNYFLLNCYMLLAASGVKFMLLLLSLLPPTPFLWHCCSPDYSSGNIKPPCIGCFSTLLDYILPLSLLQNRGG